MGRNIDARRPGFFKPHLSPARPARQRSGLSNDVVRAPRFRSILGYGVVGHGSVVERFRNEQAAAPLRFGSRAMRRIVCAAAALLPYCLSSPVTAQDIAGVEIATSAAAGSADAVGARAAVAPGDAVPTPYRVVAPSTVCATPALLQQYAFKEDFPQEITCERINFEVLL